MLSCFGTHLTFTNYQSNNIIGITFDIKFLYVVGLHLVFKAYVYLNLCKVRYTNAPWPWHLKGPCWILGTTFHPLVIRCWTNQGGWSKFSQLKKRMEILNFFEKNDMINVPRITKDPFSPSHIHRSQSSKCVSFGCTKGQWMTSASLKSFLYDFLNHFCDPKGGGLFEFHKPPYFSLGKNFGIELEASIIHILNFSFVVELFYISSPFSDSIINPSSLPNIGHFMCLSRKFFLLFSFSLGRRFIFHHLS